MSGKTAIATVHIRARLSLGWSEAANAQARVFRVSEDAAEFSDQGRRG